MLKSSWDRCWQNIGAQIDGSVLMQKLLLAYSAPHRKYHTIQHLSECLELFEQYYRLAERPAEVEIAIWFHDAIYDTRASDNEMKSAVWAERELLAASVDPEKIERIKNHILATQHSVLPEGNDQQLLVDIDLSILGACHFRFEEYEEQIRAEYKWVPQSIFVSKRKEILNEFLDRRPIFHTPDLFKVFEDQARVNLVYSIWSLERQIYSDLDNSR